jgi:tetratricopeptide (TPR) repeat protein
VPDSPAIHPKTCSLVRELISDWAKDKGGPFPYLQVGEHLAACPTCLSWATDIAYQPTDHYVRALRLRLSWVVGILGQSVLRAWSNDQNLRFDIVCAQDPELVRERIAKRLTQCESYNPEMKGRVSTIRELMPDPATGAPPSGLEPYALASYFLESALQMAPQSGQRLKLLDQLGIAEYTRAVQEQRAGRSEQADRHFERAKEYYRKVIESPKSEVRISKSGVRGSDAADVSVGERIDQVSARLSLAQVEYVQGGQSRPALEKAIELCLDAKQLVRESGLDEEKFTRIQSNLLICYLKLYLDYGETGALEQARQLADETCARPATARVFLKRWVADGEDPELTQLLAFPPVRALSDCLSSRAKQVLRAGAVSVG